MVPARKENFKVTVGEPRIYVKTAESGNRSVQSFCKQCGSPIYSSAETEPSVFMIHVGTTRQRAQLRPNSQIWCHSALSWLADPWPTQECDKQPTKNVLVSHPGDCGELADLKEVIAAAGLTVRDSSVSVAGPDDKRARGYVKSKIAAPEIRWAGTLLVYITAESKKSEWVNWEVEYAGVAGKRVVGIYADGANESDVPEALEQYADDVSVSTVTVLSTRS